MLTFKRLFWGVVLLLVVLLGIIVVRTLSFRSKQIAVDPAPPIAVDEEAAAVRLGRAVSIRTVSHQNKADDDAQVFSTFVSFLEETYPRVHSALKKETFDGFSLLYTWQGQDPSLKPIVLMAHFDVVPIAPGTESLWEREPFGGEVAGGYIWGRGTIDDKGSLIGILEAVELLLGQRYAPRRTVYLAFGHDEEVLGNGARLMADHLESKGVEAEFVLDEGMVVTQGIMPGVARPVALIGIAEKGYLSVELKVTSEGGHSSQPPPETAVGLLSKAIYRLETHQVPGGMNGPVRKMFDYVGPEMPFLMKALFANLWLSRPLVEGILSGSPATNAAMRTTTAPTILEAGVKENVLPTHARAVVNFRILPGDSIDSVLAHIQKTINDPRVVVTPLEGASNPSPVSDVDTEAFDVIQRSLLEVLPEAIVAPYLVLGATDSRHFTNVSPNIYRFVPFAFTSEDLARTHGTNERLGVENFGLVIRFYVQLIKNAAGF